MKKAKSILSKEAVEELRRGRFSGRLLIRWKNGVIDDLDFNNERLNK